MADLGKTINALGRCESYGYCEDKKCPYYECVGCLELLRKDALSLIQQQQARIKELETAQTARVMTLEEVEALPYGYVLIETDKKDLLHWVDALLFCKNTNFSFDFITLEGRARLLGTAYNMEWRCWTSRPTDKQREDKPWDA